MVRMIFGLMLMLLFIIIEITIMQSSKRAAMISNTILDAAFCLFPGIVMFLFGLRAKISYKSFFMKFSKKQWLTSKDYKQLTKILTTHKNADMRCKAAVVLGDFAYKGSSIISDEALCRALEDTSDSVRIAAEATLAKTKGVVNCLCEFLRDNSHSKESRIRAARALGEIGSLYAESTLQVILTDKDSDVCAIAKDSLSKLKPVRQLMPFSVVRYFFPDDKIEDHYIDGKVVVTQRGKTWVEHEGGNYPYEL